MTGRVTQRPRSRLDLLEQFVYLGEEAGVGVAERYLAAVEETCARLGAQSLRVAPYDSGIERLAGLRRVPLMGFDKYLLFYMPNTDGIDVVRVLHAARDIESIFRIEEG
jgi:toxin ParE1/3/4